MVRSDGYSLFCFGSMREQLISGGTRNSTSMTLYTVTLRVNCPLVWLYGNEQCCSFNSSLMTPAHLIHI